MSLYAPWEHKAQHAIKGHAAEEVRSPDCGTVPQCAGRQDVVTTCCSVLVENTRAWAAVNNDVVKPVLSGHLVVQSTERAHESLSANDASIVFLAPCRIHAQCHCQFIL